MIWARLGWLLAALCLSTIVVVLVLVAVGRYGQAMILTFAIIGFGQAAAGCFALAPTTRASSGPPR
jgi:hypothetical protein